MDGHKLIGVNFDEDDSTTNDKKYPPRTTTEGAARLDGYLEKIFFRHGKLLTKDML